MTKPEALEAARRHIAWCNAETPLPLAYQWEVDEPREYRDFWYFDYNISHRRGLPWAEWEDQFVGAPGYVVSKRSGDVQAISWGHSSALRQYRERMQYFEQRAAGQERQPFTRQELRQHFTMPLLEMQAFKRELEAPGLTNAQVLRRLETHLIREDEWLSALFDTSPAIC